jgi:hypothetical protein
VTLNVTGFCYYKTKGGKMKTKLTLLATILLLVTQANATCTKTEVMKLIDKGFGKAEISSICDIHATSTTKHKLKPKSKWMSPSRKACTKNGGKLKSGGICAANWQNAKRICSVSGGRLPNINELKSVLTSCGGLIGDYKFNKNNLSYQACYKQKGFFFSGDDWSDYYWSSSVYVPDTVCTWAVNFRVGDVGGADKTDEYYVRCVRGIQ